MKAKVNLDQCLSFINCQLQPGRPSATTPQDGTQRRAITISRQTGSDGHALAEKLVEHLQAQAPPDAYPWTVFDRNLVEKVLEEHHLPGRLARFMPEDRISEISDTIDELFGLHPPSWTLVRQTSETILHLVELGNVIIIGRGANVITAGLDYVLHVRLIGSLQRRVQRIQELSRLDAKTAQALVTHEDLGRKRYLKKYFGKDIDDPVLYHLVINTDRVPYAEAALMIAQAMTPRTVAVPASERADLPHHSHAAPAVQQL